MIAERTPDPAHVPDLDAVFAEQRRRSRAEPYRPAAYRKLQLERLERAILRRRGEIEAALLADFRKPREETAYSELIVTLAELRHAKANLAAWMRPAPVATSLSTFGSKAEIRYEPKGVALIMAPWHYPFQLTIAPLVAAIAAGCRAIVRPSEKAPATRDVLARIVADAFEPHDVALARGEVDVAERLLAFPFDHFFFTGGTAVGKIVMKAAAEHLASVTLELGGKSPCIVDASADLAWAAKRIAFGKFYNGGQTCVAPDYVLVHERVERPFVARLRAAIAAMYGADEAARKATPDFARIVDDGHFRRVAGLIDETVRGGATVECGGVTDAAERYVAPTVLANVAFDAPVMREEIFGPVLPVLTYRSLDDALAQINARPKPLALYVFSTKSAVADRVIDATSAGGTLVNDTVLHFAHPNLPVGGVGESGNGNYHGHCGFRAFSHERAVMRQSKATLAPMLAPPYTRATRSILALLERLP
ncbi:MAG: aldehyde dehydrogenase family protein [Candidatus Eremiobacteraeota bacterium]|nr:aldehyde dehydrogenase family protein [Candidatus Eremiobacteraeota bacterium]